MYKEFINFHSKYIKYANNNYSSSYFSQAAAITLSSLHCTGDWFLVIGATIPVELNKLVSKMVSSNENWLQTCPVLINSIRIWLKIWFVFWHHEHLLASATKMRRGHELWCYMCAGASLECFAPPAQPLNCSGTASVSERSHCWQVSWTSNTKGVKYRENMIFPQPYSIECHNWPGHSYPPSLRVIPQEFSKTATVAIANFLAIAESKIE